MVAAGAVLVGVGVASGAVGAARGDVGGEEGGVGHLVGVGLGAVLGVPDDEAPIAECRGEQRDEGDGRGALDRCLLDRGGRGVPCGAVAIGAHGTNSVGRRRSPVPERGSLSCGLGRG